jgi:hypothetical protein
VFPLRRFASFVDANAPLGLGHRNSSSLLLSSAIQEPFDSFSSYSRGVGEERILDPLPPDTSSYVLPDIAPPTPLKLETRNSFNFLSRPKYTSKEFAEFVKTMDSASRKSDSGVRNTSAFFAIPVASSRLDEVSVVSVKSVQPVNVSIAASSSIDSNAVSAAADASASVPSSTLSLDERIAAVSTFLASFSVEEYLEQAAQRRKFIEESLIKPPRPATTLEAPPSDAGSVIVDSISLFEPTLDVVPSTGVVDLASEEADGFVSLAGALKAAEPSEPEVAEPTDLILPSYYFNHPHLSRSAFYRLGAFLFPRSAKTGAPQFSSDYNADKEVGRIESDYVRWDSLQKLYPREWINDDVVNFVRTRVNLEAAFHALKEFPASAMPSSKIPSREPKKGQFSSFTSSFRSEPQPPAPKSRPSPANPDPVPFLDGSGAIYSRAKVFSWNSYFLSQLHTPARGYDFSSVKRWTKKNGLNIFQTDVLLFPVNIPNVHWSLAAIDIPGHAVHYYDSMFGICLDQVKGYLSSITKWICEEARARISEGVQNPYPETWFSDSTSWKVELHSNKTVPRQENGYDCGIFALAALRSIALGHQFDYSQRDMSFFRMRIALDVLDDPPKGQSSASD